MAYSMHSQAFSASSVCPFTAAKFITYATSTVRAMQTFDCSQAGSKMFQSCVWSVQHLRHRKLRVPVSPAAQDWRNASALSICRHWPRHEGTL